MPSNPLSSALRDKGIPFTQYLMPRGERHPVWIRRPDDVQEQARAVIEAGFAFECEMLSDYRSVSLTVSDGEDDVEIEVCANGPDVPNAVDRLVAKAFSPVERAP